LSMIFHIFYIVLDNRPEIIHNYYAKPAIY